MRILIRIGLLLCGLLLVAYGSLVLALWMHQDSFVFNRSTIVPETLVGRMRQGGLELVRAPGPQGEMVFWASPTDRAAKGIVLYTPGNGGSAADWGDRPSAAVRAGFAVVAVGYPGYDGNPGAPSEIGMIVAAKAQLAWAQERWPDQPIVLWGESMGGAVAIAVASDTKVAGVITDGTFTSIRELGQRMFPYVPVGWLVQNQFDSLARMPRIRAPVLIVHGANDRLVPADMAPRLVAAATCAVMPLLLPRVGHTAWAWSLRNDEKGNPTQGVVMKFLADAASGSLGGCALSP